MHWHWILLANDQICVSRVLRPRVHIGTEGRVHTTHMSWMQTHIPKHSSVLRPSLDQSSTSSMSGQSKNWFRVNLSLHWGLDTLQWFWFRNDMKHKKELLTEIHVHVHWKLSVANSNNGVRNHLYPSIPVMIMNSSWKSQFCVSPMSEISNFYNTFGVIYIILHS